MQIFPLDHDETGIDSTARRHRWIKRKLATGYLQEPALVLGILRHAILECLMQLRARHLYAHGLVQVGQNLFQVTNPELAFGVNCVRAECARVDEGAVRVY